MRRRLVVLIVAGLLGLGAPGQSNAAENEVAAAETQGVAANGEGTTAAGSEATATPAEAAPPTNPGPPTGGPEQQTSSESDADVSNDAGVDQSSGQAQDGGDTGEPTTAGDGAAQSGQEAHTAQQVQADAAASSNNAHNDAASVRAGEGNAGDGAGVQQSSGAAADATATATQATGQQGAGTATSAGEQSATASANASAADSANTLLDARFGAPGDDAAFDQSVQAGAAARAELEGPGNAQQHSHADATAEVGNARNTAVELRIGSDGDSAGGRQSIVADANATAADAGASAVLENPFNTFVSLRVNSSGTTGPVQQEISRRESETVNGSVTERLSEDAADRTWQFDADGIGIDFASDGANTDLRISVDQSTLADPSQAPLFVWQWDMVFGPGSQPDCEITSSAAADRVTWSFDCDPDDQIERAEAGAAVAPPAGALSWIWSWLRPQLPEWSWEQNDVILLPACGPTCTMLLDFRWISLEPIEESVAPTADPELEGAVDAEVEAAVQQANEVTASATASAESTIEQTLIQSGGDQAALQQAAVSQLVTAHAAAELTDVDNVSTGIAAHVAQANRATTLVTAAAGAEIVQLLSQQQTGESTTQTQVALQFASTTQELIAGAIATVSTASNSDLSVGGSATQSAIGSATVTGVELASTRQVTEQEQQGDDSDQEQLAGQWADTAQQLELLAAAGVAGARISSTLNGDAATLEIGAEAVSTGTSKSAIHQLTLQHQAGDEVAQQQESYQIASVEQSGTALAAATAGGTLRYVLVPVAAGPAPSTAEALGEPLLQATIPAPIESSSVPVTVVLAASANSRAQSPSRRPALTPLRPTDVRQQAAARAAPLTILVTKDSASKAGVAGPAPKRAKDAERAPVRSPRDLCLAPCIGASAAASAGTGSGSALVALLPGASLLSVPRLGRWLTTPAGRRSAAFLLLRAKPG